VRTGITALNLLNTGIPLSPGKKRFFLKTLKIRMLLRGKRPQDLKRLPYMKNRQILAVMNTLAEIMTPAMLYKSECAMYVGLKMMEFTLEHGNTDQSPFVYSVFGTILAGRNENYKSAHAYGRLQLLWRSRVMIKTSFVKPAFSLQPASIIGWRMQTPVSICIKRLTLAARESDNQVLSAWAAASILTVHVVTGSRLSKVTEEIEKYMHLVKRIKYDDMTNFFLLSGRYISALKGETPDMSDFCGDDFDEALFMRDMESTCRHNGILAYYYTMKCQLLFLSGQYEKVLEAANRWRISALN
jgi:predicted ATPase